MARMLALALALICLASESFKAQAPTAQQSEPFRFSTAVTEIQVTAVVRDKDGKFVSGLTLEDFEIFESNKLQEISSFDEINIPVPGVDVPSMDAPLPLDTSTNADIKTARFYVLALDDYTSPSLGPRVREIARDFVENQMGPSDRVAVYYLGSDSRIEFTHDRLKLLAFINGFTGRPGDSGTPELVDFKSPGTNSQPENELPQLPDMAESFGAQNASNAMDRLGHIATWLSHLNHAQRVLILISTGVAAGSGALMGREAMAGAEIRDALIRAIEAAKGAGVSYWPIDAAGLRAPAGFSAASSSGPVRPGGSMKGTSDSSLDSLQILAANTGGIAGIHSNDFSSQLKRIVEEYSHYYSLSYRYQHGPDGKFRPIKVRIKKRPGLKVKARLGHRAETPKQAKLRKEWEKGIKESSKGKDGKVIPALEYVRRVATSTTPVENGLRITINPVAYKNAAGKPSARVILQVNGSVMPMLDEGGDRPYHNQAMAVVIVRDQYGNWVGETNTGMGFRFTQEERAMFRYGGWRKVFDLELKPGEHTVSVAVAENTGATGSISHSLSVPDFGQDKPASSGIMLGSLAAHLFMPSPTAEELAQLWGINIADSRAFGIMLSSLAAHLFMPSPTAEELAQLWGINVPMTASRAFVVGDEIFANVELYPGSQRAKEWEVLFQLLNEKDEVVRRDVRIYGPGDLQKDRYGTRAVIYTEEDSSQGKTLSPGVYRIQYQAKEVGGKKIAVEEMASIFIVEKKALPKAATPESK